MYKVVTNHHRAAQEAHEESQPENAPFRPEEHAVKVTPRADLFARLRYYICDTVWTIVTATRGLLRSVEARPEAQLSIFAASSAFAGSVGCWSTIWTLIYTAVGIICTC